MKTYCVRCKAKTDTLNAKQVISSNGKPMMQGNCQICHCKKSTFLGETLTKKVKKKKS